MNVQYSSNFFQGTVEQHDKKQFKSLGFADDVYIEMQYKTKESVCVVLCICMMMMTMMCA